MCAPSQQPSRCHWTYTRSLPLYLACGTSTYFGLLEAQSLPGRSQQWRQDPLAFCKRQHTVPLVSLRCPLVLLRLQMFYLGWATAIAELDGGGMRPGASMEYQVRTAAEQNAHSACGHAGGLP